MPVGEDNGVEAPGRGVEGQATLHEGGAISETKSIGNGMAHFHPVPERIDLLLVENVLANAALLRVHDALPHFLVVSCARYATDHIVLPNWDSGSMKERAVSPHPAPAVWPTHHIHCRA